MGLSKLTPEFHKTWYERDKKPEKKGLFDRIIKAVKHWFIGDTFDA